MLRLYLQIWETPDSAASMRVMLQSATSNTDAHEAFRGFMQSYVLPAVSGALGGGEQARLRAMLAGSQLVGVAMLRYVMQIPPLATLTRRRGHEADRADVDALSDRRRRRAGAARALAAPEAVNSLVQHHETDHDQNRPAMSTACWRSIQSFSRCSG